MGIFAGPRDRGGLSEADWRKATRFDATDWGWVIMSIGMAIGAGIVFLPVQVGLVGLWVFLLSAVVGYPAMYLFQRLFLNTVAASPNCRDYPEVISGYLGRNWGMFLGLLYFLMLVIWVFVYSTALTNDSASYLHTFGLTSKLLSENPFYSLALIVVLVLVASRGEAVLFKIATVMVLTKIGIVAFLGVSMIGMWDIHNIGALPHPVEMTRQAVVTLPFTLTSILFLQSLSPMVVSYRAREQVPAVAHFKAIRAMNIAFTVLFVVVFFYAISFTLAMGHTRAVEAFQRNLSALAVAAEFLPPGAALILAVILNLFALMTAFFSVFLGMQEACSGLAINLLSRWLAPERINHRLLDVGVKAVIVGLAWGVVVLEIPVLYFTSMSSPIFGLVGCLIPVYLVWKVDALARYRGPVLWLIAGTGILLLISPLLAAAGGSG